MNHSRSGAQPFDKAITSFLYFKSAEGLADRTIDSYQCILKQCSEHWGPVNVTKLTSQDISGYLSWLRTDYVLRRYGGKTHTLSPKTLRNVWIASSSFFVWATKEFQIKNPMQDVPPPRYQKAPVESYTQEDLKLMLKACTYSKEAATTQRRSFTMRRATANRDQAIVLVLLDSGIRASEFCALSIGDFDAKRGKLNIQYRVEGGAKGGKGRSVYLGKVSRQAVWRYLSQREDGQDLEAPLFTVARSRSFNPGTLRQLIKRIGDRAGV